jgi:hypothetical protein
MAISKYLVDILTRAQVYLERAKSGLVQEFDPELEKYIRLATQKLQAANKPLAELSQPEMEQLIREIFRAEQAVITPWQDDLTAKLKDVASHETEFTATALDRAIVGDVTIGTVTAADAWKAALEHPVRAKGKLLEPFIRDFTETTLDAVEGVIRNAHAQGFTIEETVRAIRGTRARGYADGVAAGVRRNMETLVRTSVQHVSGTARSAIFEANSDIVTGERWISTLDNATCERCGALDQQTFPFGKGPRPPLHLSCRCCTVSEMDESLELLGGGTRASKGASGGAQVPASQTYYGWLKTQPAAFQDDAIGATRGKLLRNGGLSAEEFARLNLGRTFEPLTLDEMRAKAPGAFSKAGLE